MEYSGHGELFSEPLYKDVDQAVDDLCNRIIKDQPHEYILWGHSFGTLISLLIAEKLDNSYSTKPKAVVLSGLGPPHLYYKYKKLSELEKGDFMQHIYEMGQTDDEIMKCPELYEIIYGVIHHDIKLKDDYTYDPSTHKKLNVPICALAGSDDNEVYPEDMKQWQIYTESRFYYQLFQGNHFFPFKCAEYKPYFRSIIKKAMFNML